MEQFNSPTQQSLFAGHADDFLSGLNRAFTLAGGQNATGPTEFRNTAERAERIFTNHATGARFRVTVEAITE